MIEDSKELLEKSFYILRHPLLMNEQERSIFQVGDELWQKKGGPGDPAGFSLR